MSFLLPLQQKSLFVVVCAVLLIIMNAISINCANNCPQYKKEHSKSFSYSVLSLVVAIILCLGGLIGLFFAGTPLGRALNFVGVV
jgi:hypothetical protein